MRHEQIDLCIFSGLGIIGVRMVFQLFFSQGVNTDRRVVIVFFFFGYFTFYPILPKPLLLVPIILRSGICLDLTLNLLCSCSLFDLTELEGEKRIDTYWNEIIIWIHKIHIYFLDASYFTCTWANQPRSAQMLPLPLFFSVCWYDIALMTDHTEILIHVSFLFRTIYLPTSIEYAVALI